MGLIKTAGHQPAKQRQETWVALERAHKPKGEGESLRQSYQPARAEGTSEGPGQTPSLPQGLTPKVKAQATSEKVDKAEQK